MGMTDHDAVSTPIRQQAEQAISNSLRLLTKAEKAVDDGNAEAAALLIGIAERWLQVASAQRATSQGR